MTHTMKVIQVILDDSAKKASILAKDEIQRLILRMKFKYNVQITNLTIGMGTWSYDVEGLNEYDMLFRDDQFDLESISDDSGGENLAGLIGAFIDLLQLLTDHPNMDIIS